jgi:hypothetical protein
VRPAPTDPCACRRTTLRALTQTLVAIQDRSLTGNYRSDDVYGNNSCEEPDPAFTTCIGDSSNANSAYRGFVTFDPVRRAPRALPRVPYRRSAVGVELRSRTRRAWDLDTSGAAAAEVSMQADDAFTFPGARGQ